MVDLQDNLFMLPGPVKMHPRVLSAMSVPARAHRDPSFNQIHAEIRDHLQYLFQSKSDVCVLSGSGTAGLDASVSNFFNKDHTVVSIDNGKFGERVGDIVDIHANLVRVKSEWGTVPPLDEIAAAVEDNDADAITLCHNETASSLTNQAEEIGKIARKNDALFLLDGITSVGGIDVNPDRLNADVVIFGSQKCIAAPSGMACLCVNDRAKERFLNRRPYYLDLKKHLDKYMNPEKPDTPYTCAIPLFQGLREALALVREEGLEARFHRLASIGEATRQAGDALGLKLFADREFASSTLTGFWYPDGITDKQFRGTLKDKWGVIVAGAQDHIKGKVFRIGHMGLTSWTDMAATFAAMEATMAELNIPFDKGAGVGTIADHMGKYNPKGPQ